VERKKYGNPIYKYRIFYEKNLQKQGPSVNEFSLMKPFATIP
jgi:hypothetical protein